MHHDPIFGQDGVNLTVPGNQLLEQAPPLATVRTGPLDLAQN